MEERKEPKLVHRLIPCPQYDVSGMECWLSDMAKQGYHLQKDGFFAGVATFEKSTPQTVIYQLQPSEKSTSMWADNNGDPDEEAVELSKEYGWEYVAKRGEFHVYRTFDPEARAFHTDPEVQALPEDAHTPSASRYSSRLSPSMPSKQKLTLPGKRFFASPLRLLWGI